MKPFFFAAFVALLLLGGCANNQSPDKNKEIGAFSFGQPLRNETDVKNLLLKDFDRIANGLDTCFSVKLSDEKWILEHMAIEQREEPWNYFLVRIPFVDQSSDWQWDNNKVLEKYHECKDPPNPVSSATKKTPCQTGFIDGITKASNITFLVTSDGKISCKEYFQSCEKPSQKQANGISAAPFFPLHRDNERFSPATRPLFI